MVEYREWDCLQAVDEASYSDWTMEDKASLRQDVERLLASPVMTDEAILDLFAKLGICVDPRQTTRSPGSLFDTRGSLRFACGCSQWPASRYRLNSVRSRRFYGCSACVL